MATIHKIESGYRVQIRRKGQPSVSKNFKRKTDAERWVRQVESEMDNGKHFPQDQARKKTLADVIAKYRADELPRLRSASDRDHHLRYWEESIGSKPLIEIRPAIISEIRIRLQEDDRAPSTVNRYVAALSCLFTYAIKTLQWIEINPCLSLKSLSEPPAPDRTLSKQEMSALLEACQRQNPMLYLIVSLALSTGARRGEILGLKWKDINLETGLLTFPQTKNGKIRYIPVFGENLEALRALRLSSESVLVFQGRSGKPLNIENIWRQAMKRAGIEGLRFHDLRHTAASNMIMSNINASTVAEILGHSDLKMTARYTHLSREHLDKAVKTLDESLKA